MKKQIKARGFSERGIALLTVLMALVMMSALTVAILLVASQESFMAGKHRSNASVFYAATAGLAEARGRMLYFHPNALTGGPSPVSLPYSPNEVVYLLNPAPGEIVDPVNLGNKYADMEYRREFGTTVPTVTKVPPVAGSVSSTIPFKWVRITVKTEQSANTDINGDGVIDATTPVFYDGKRQNLAFNGDMVYRLTGLAALPNGASRIVQADLAGQLKGFDYALAVDGTCEMEPMGVIATVTGNVQCNSHISLQGTMAVSGTFASGGQITGPGAVNLTSATGQVQANGPVTVGVTNSTGTPPSVTSGSGTVTPMVSPATPTPAPLPLNTMPNPSATSLIAAVTQTNPVGTCVGGNLVFDLGNATPKQVFEFNGTPYMTACGTILNPTSFPANVVFSGTGTIWLSNSPGLDTKFNNNFGTPTTPVDLNIIVRPRDNTVGTGEVEFAGGVNNIRGLIYVQGEIETEPAKTALPTGGVGHPTCPKIASQQFSLSGAMMSYGPNASFEISSCSTNVGITYNPMQLLRGNPPPGFGGLLVFGIGNSVVLNWRDIVL